MSNKLLKALCMILKLVLYHLYSTLLDSLTSWCNSLQNLTTNSRYSRLKKRSQVICKAFKKRIILMTFIFESQLFIKGQEMEKKGHVVEGIKV